MFQSPTKAIEMKSAQGEKKRAGMKWQEQVACRRHLDPRRHFHRHHRCHSMSGMMMTTRRIAKHQSRTSQYGGDHMSGGKAEGLVGSLS